MKHRRRPPVPDSSSRRFQKSFVGLNFSQGENMNTKIFTPMLSLRELQQCSDVADLTPALHRLCSSFGRVDKLSVLTAMHKGARQAICFLRLESPEKERILMKKLGVGRFGGEVVFVVDLKPAAIDAEFAPASLWSDFDGAESSSNTQKTPASEHSPLSIVTHQQNYRSDSPLGL